MRIIRCRFIIPKFEVGGFPLMFRVHEFCSLQSINILVLSPLLEGRPSNTIIDLDPQTTSRPRAPPNAYYHRHSPLNRYSPSKLPSRTSIIHRQNIANMPRKQKFHEEILLRVSVLQESPITNHSV